MPKPNMNDMLKRRMAAAQQASELQTSDEAYQQIFREKLPVGAAKLARWTTIPAEVVEADDARAIVVATSTNLIQRQGLTTIERGKAYKALLDAKNRQGYRSDMQSQTSGDSHQKYSARALVAEFFGVTEYEIRKAIKLTQLIPELADILEDNPKQLNLACADWRSRSRNSS